MSPCSLLMTSSRFPTVNTAKGFGLRCHTIINNVYYQIIKKFKCFNRRKTKQMFNTRPLPPENVPPRAAERGSQCLESAPWRTRIGFWNIYIYICTRRREKPVPRAEERATFVGGRDQKWPVNRLRTLDAGNSIRRGRRAVVRRRSQWLTHNGLLVVGKQNETNSLADTCVVYL